MNYIPSDEEFARVRRLMREDERNLDKVCKAVDQRFRGVCPLHYVYIMPQRDVTFRAFVFFVKDTDLKACRRTAVTQEIEDFIFEELERAGRGRRPDITVAFEWDSDENVRANYEGDYFLRLR